MGTVIGSVDLSRTFAGGLLIVSRLDRVARSTIYDRIVNIIIQDR